MSEKRAEVTDAAAVRRVGELSTLFTPWALRAAVTLRLPDLVNEGVTELAPLARRCGADAGALERLLRHLVLLGVFREEAEGYRLGELGRVLCHDHPARLALFLDQEEEFSRLGDEVIPELTRSVRTGRSSWSARRGREFWADLAENAELSGSFDRTMAVHGGRVGPLVARHHDFTSVRRIVDVGGGTGQTLAALLAAHPHLHGTLVDQPATAARAAGALAVFAGRATVAPQSFFDELPPDGDLYLLANVLHDWNDTDAERILRRCAEAAGPGGRVLVADRVLTAGESTMDSMDSEAARHGALVVSARDLAMLLLFEAGERTEAEFAGLGKQAGLDLAATVPAAPEQGLYLLDYRAAG